MKDSHHSYEEYDYRKIEKKSEEFLKRIMGKEKFDELQKNGKIEIDHNTEKDKTIYELYSDGKIINKSKNQSYCIVADSSDYPVNDMVAIKYAWLTHENDVAEKVANKTHLYTGRVDRANRSSMPVGYGDFIRDMEQRGWSRQQVSIDPSSPWYGDYVDYLTGLGWNRELIVLDQNNVNLATIYGIQKDTTDTIIDIGCPPDMKMTIMGKRQVPPGADQNVAYSIGLHIDDENGEEIPDDTDIRIAKIKSSEDILQLARIYYSHIKMERRGYNWEPSYRFGQGIEINGEDHFNVTIVNSKRNIPAENVKFEMETDLWASD